MKNMKLKFKGGIALAIIAFAACFLTGKTKAQTFQFSQATYLTVTTNSPSPLATTVFGVQVPSISLNITATNTSTIVTNTVFQVLSATNSYTFIYNASTMGTNFTTNWPSTYFLVTNSTYGQASPQSGGSNTVFIK